MVGKNITSAAHPGYRLHCVGFKRNRGISASFDVGMTKTNLGSKWEAREMRGFGIELDAGYLEVGKGRRRINGTPAARLTPREEVDEMLIAIVPKKQPKHTISMPPPTVDEGKSH